MYRLFGKKKEEPTVSITDAIQSLDERSGSIEVKIAKLDGQLSALQQKMNTTRPGPLLNSIRQRAMNVLKQKKLYESQLQQLQQQSFNMEQTAMTTESLKNTMVSVQALQQTAKQLKAQNKQISLEKIDALQDELQEYLDSAGELNDILGQNMSSVDIDDEELDAELEALQQDQTWAEQQEQTNGLPAYLQPLNDLPEFVDEETKEATTAQ
ncbi:vacuolar sorting protein Vps60 [Schizosaccharomyces japonicus yFS275]|uniref:Vacuolar sorting protein Vps60 n=1 Tax=Schizosaccharomyces japonicus (strain yFS275 / FY16936) TaxID=402676 RepID=B6K7D5_SCHJY|nr:vacuolar sorting protein Vps60 [Schizosaccharomyces japonicus yFS275]EEB09439.2 vacuolar sorting protein Vps60 [Schizosaccharomyces japonicus yFS275]